MDASRNNRADTLAKNNRKTKPVNSPSSPTSPSKINSQAKKKTAASAKSGVAKKVKPEKAQADKGKISNSTAKLTNKPLKKQMGKPDQNRKTSKQAATKKISQGTLQKQKVKNQAGKPGQKHKTTQQKPAKAVQGAGNSKPVSKPQAKVNQKPTQNAPVKKTVQSSAPSKDKPAHRKDQQLNTKQGSVKNKPVQNTQLSNIAKGATTKTMPKAQKPQNSATMPRQQPTSTRNTVSPQGEIKKQVPDSKQYVPKAEKKLSQVPAQKITKSLLGRKVTKGEFLQMALRPVSQYNLSSKVVEVSADDKIGKVFGILKNHRLLSVPVFDFKKNAYLGFIDASDLLVLVFKTDEYVMDLLDHELDQQHVNEIVTNGWNNNIGSESPCRILFEKCVCPSYPFLPVSPSTQMQQVLKSLNHVTKRVPILNPNTGRIQQVLSHSTLIDYVHRRILWLEEQGAILPDEFNYRTKELGYIKSINWMAEYRTLEETFSLMINHCRSTIAIKDQKDKIFTTVTTRDILCFENLQEVGNQRFEYEKYTRNVKAGKTKAGNAPVTYMTMQVGDFVANIKQANIKSSKPAVTTAPVSATLSNIIRLLAETKIHRLFIVDNQRRPVGVASVKDVIGSLLEYQLLGNDPAKGYSERLRL
mmetsp:Transcript_2834/g.3821  ORF Transcript_2834/g.3821 Transcript_2834/m.3821 type:complete len:642 (-) Transcript_2834:3321-5246(-)